VFELDNISDTLEKLSTDRQENKSDLIKQAELLRQKIAKAKQTPSIKSLKRKDRY
jgi:hypothetical protein